MNSISEVLSSEVALTKAKSRPGTGENFRARVHTEG